MLVENNFFYLIFSFFMFPVNSDDVECVKKAVNIEINDWKAVNIEIKTEKGVFLNKSHEYE